MRPRRPRLVIVMFALLLAACATPVGTTIQPSAAHLAKYNDLSALDVVTALEKNVNEAKAAGMPFLAPHYFREVSQILSDSQNGLSHKPKDELVQQAAKGDAILEKGRAVMTIVQYRFANELELKAHLDKLDTAKLLPKEYGNVMGDFADLIARVEREQPDNIDKNKEALLKALQDLEVKAVQESALHASEAINAESKTRNADKQAPATFAEALRVFQDAKTQIAAAPHDSELVQRLGAQALFAARHAQQVNERVAELQAQLKGTSSSSPALGAAVGLSGAAHVSAQAGGGTSGSLEKSAVEKVVLQEEDRLFGISTALGHKDLRDLALDKQVQEIKRVAAAAAAQTKNEACVAASKNLGSRLQAADDATQKAMMQLADKDQLLATQSAQLADKDAQIAELKATIMAKEKARAGKAKKK